MGTSTIISRNASTIEYEITASQGEYRVVFTSKERWIHRVESKDYIYRQTEFGYMDDLQKEIEAKIIADATGTFPVIDFLIDKTI